MSKKPSLADFVPKSKIRNPVPSPQEREWMAAAGENETLGEYTAERSAPAAADPTPRPTPRPADLRKPKKLVCRATPDFHYAVKVTAARRGMSIEEMMTVALEELMARWDSVDGY